MRGGPEVIADGSEHGVDGVAGRMGKIIAAHAMLGFHVADDRLDGGPSPQLAFDALGDAALDADRGPADALATSAWYCPRTGVTGNAYEYQALLNYGWPPLGP